MIIESSKWLHNTRNISLFINFQLTDTLKSNKYVQENEYLVPFRLMSICTPSFDSELFPHGHHCNAGNVDLKFLSISVLGLH